MRHEPCGYLGGSIPGKGNNSRCKGPEVGICLVSWRISKEARVAAAETGER